MRVPTRKSEKDNITPVDTHITQTRFDELVAKQARMKQGRPKLAEEVKRLAEMGDFSENAAYQIAKGRLRGLNNRLRETEWLLNHAVIIAPEGVAQVQEGHAVTVRMHGKEKTYRILGGNETDPDRNIISRTSPLGAALMGKRVGEEATLKLADRDVVYTIVGIAG